MVRLCPLRGDDVAVRPHAERCTFVAPNLEPVEATKEGNRDIQPTKADRHVARRHVVRRPAGTWEVPDGLPATSRRHVDQSLSCNEDHLAAYLAAATAASALLPRRRRMHSRHRQRLALSYHGVQLAQ